MALLMAPIVTSAASEPSRSTPRSGKGICVLIGPSLSPPQAAQRGQKAAVMTQPDPEDPLKDKYGDYPMVQVGRGERWCGGRGQE